MLFINIFGKTSTKYIEYFIRRFQIEYDKSFSTISSIIIRPFAFSLLCVIRDKTLSFFNDQQRAILFRQYGARVERTLSFSVRAITGGLFSAGA